MTPRRLFVFLLALAVGLAGIAPVGMSPAWAADGALDTGIDGATKKLTQPAFWKGVAGASFGAWLGTEALKWEPVLTTTSDIAGVTPFGSVMVRAMVPLLAAAVGAQVAAKGITHADWRLIAAQTVGGAVGTAIALVVAPEAGMLAPLAGDLLGSFTGTKILAGLRRRGGPALAAFGVPPAPAAASLTVPTITGAHPAAPSTTELAKMSAKLRAAYERWLDATRAGNDQAARAAYAEYLADSGH